MRLCAGKPLVQWTINATKQSKLLDSVVVTSDDDCILNIAKNNQVHANKRPKNFATDSSLILDTLKYIIQEFPGYSHVVLLQPTSPIRNKNLIDECIKKYQKSDCDVLVTGFDCHYKPYESYVGRRQDLDTFFYNDGNVYILPVERIKQNLLNSPHYCRFYTSRQEAIEIDDEFDFWLAEQILLNYSKTQ